MYITELRIAEFRLCTIFNVNNAHIEEARPKAYIMNNCQLSVSFGGFSLRIVEDSKSNIFDHSPGAKGKI